MKSKKGKIVGGIVGVTMLATTVAAAMPLVSAQTTDTNSQTNEQSQGNNFRVTGKQNRGLQKGFGQGALKNIPLLKKENVVIVVTNLSNGIQETLTTTDSDALAGLKKMAGNINNKVNNKKSGANDPNTPAIPKATVKAEVLDNGIVITITSDDADVVKEIQAGAQLRELEKKLRDANVDIKASITRTVVETDKGVQINVSSDNTDVQQLIKLREQSRGDGYMRFMMGPGIGGGHRGGPGAGRPMLESENQDA
jgi:hypothetical protein